MEVLAKELVQLKPDVIITTNTTATLATRHETAIIPIVCTTCTDPVGIGLALSEARPGTNVTGMLTRVDGMTGKQLELARDVVHGLTKIGLVINPSNQSNAVQQQEAAAAAVKLGVTLVPVPVSLPTDLHVAFQTLSRESVKMVLVLQDAMFLAERKRIALFAAAAKLPTLFSFRENVEDGGLMSYGIDLRENYRRTAVYVDKILKGEKPADLPIEFPTRLVLVINLQTATAIGLTVPQSILLRADEVIE
jgi:putative ABC transport system substrate-binding protein